MHRTEGGHGLCALCKHLAIDRGVTVADTDRVLHLQDRCAVFHPDLGLDHVLGYAYHGTTGKCSWRSMGMPDWRMNQNVRSCRSCQMARGRRPQAACYGLGWLGVEATATAVERGRRVL